MPHGGGEGGNTKQFLYHPLVQYITVFMYVVSADLLFGNPSKSKLTEHLLYTLLGVML